jgi:hypothetical protein
MLFEDMTVSRGRVITKDEALTEVEKFSMDDAILIASVMGIDLLQTDPEEFHMGLNVELEHGTINAETNITNDDPIMTGKIAWAHLNEIPDYYTRLAKMEKEGKKLKETT